MYQYIGRLGRPLPCRVRSLGRPRDNKKYIWWCLRGGDRTGTIYLFYFARVLHPAMCLCPSPVFDFAASSEVHHDPT
uniref:Uncharacterized protein n=1 Tax=Triticum urartu TaxID=4572 RepID=A0A8R7TID2_TRIUA